MYKFDVQVLIRSGKDFMEPQGYVPADHAAQSAVGPFSCSTMMPRRHAAKNHLDRRYQRKRA